MLNQLHQSPTHRAPINVSRRLSWLALSLSALYVGACTGSPSTSNLSGGTHVDSGGDEVYCEASPHSPFHGSYTLDYILTHDPGSTEPDPTGDWPALKERMQTLLREKLPRLANRYAEYIDLFENRDEAQHRIWRGTDVPIDDIDDADITSQLPVNCTIVEDGQRVANLHQLVRRRYIVDGSTPKVIYLYDYDRFEHMKQNRPLQFSYLVTHEWLWDFADGAWANRSVNRLLHTTAAESLSPESLQRAVRMYGITGEEGDFLGQPSPRLAELQEIFESSPVCQYERKINVEFPIENGRAVIFPGQTRSFDLRVGDLREAIGDEGCGFALTFGHKAERGSGRLNVTLRRGVGFSPTRSVFSSQRVRHHLSHGICTNDRCVNREGDLVPLLIPESFGRSRWTLEFENVSTTPVEIHLPYFTIVKMAQ